MTEPSPQNNKPDVPKKKTLRLPIQKNSQILAIFAIVCTAIVGLVNELTKDKIKEQAQQQLLHTLHSIIEPNRYDNDITKDCINFSSAMLNKNTDSTVQTAYIARKAGKVIAVAMTNTAPDGYNGDIDFIVAVNMDNSVSGVRVLTHKETPGLGDKVELRKSDWITRFSGKKLLSDTDTRWAVAKDDGMFDQFTGATITPRAVVRSVKQTLLYFKENKPALLTRPNACQISNTQATQSSEVSDDK
jgi:electron transport complex protein RnfG